MKDLNAENSFVLSQNGLVQTRLHKSKLVYEVIDNGSPIGVTGFPPVVLEYKGEVLRGIVLKANLRSFSITLDGYPKLAVEHFEIPIFALAFGGLTLLNHDRTDLAPIAKQKAEALLKALYDDYHHPRTGAFIDVLTPALALYNDAKRNYIKLHQHDALVLADEKKSLKSAFKAGQLSECDYKKKLGSIKERCCRLDTEAARYADDAVCAFAMNAFELTSEEAQHYVHVISRRACYLAR